MWIRGLFYFVLLYGAGIALEGVRILWAGPSLGDRAPELVEAPAFLLVAAVVARSLVRGEGAPLARPAALVMGLFAAALLVAHDFVVVAPLLGVGSADYLRSRDPQAWMLYYGALAIAAVLPLVFARPPDAHRMAVRGGVP